MKLRHLIILAASALAFPAVANAAAADPAKAPAVIAAPAPGTGQVVFFRPSKYVGWAIRCTVREDGKMVGRVGNGDYFVLPATPGAHRFTTKTESTDTLNVEVEPDETTYVKCAIGMGVMAGRPNLSPATAADFGEVAHKIKAVDAAKLADEIAKDEAKRTAKTTGAN